MTSFHTALAAPRQCLVCGGVHKLVHYRRALKGLAGGERVSFRLCADCADGRILTTVGWKHRWEAAVDHEGHTDVGFHDSDPRVAIRWAFSHGNGDR